MGLFLAVPDLVQAIASTTTTIDSFTLFGLSPMLTWIVLGAAGGVVAIFILWLVFSLILHPVSKALSPTTLVLSSLAAVPSTGIAGCSICKLCFGGEEEEEEEEGNLLAKTPKTTDSIWSNAKLEPRHSPNFITHTNPIN
jgi:hypothetical protein